MSEDLPTFGIPTIITRALRGLAPLLANLAVLLFASSSALVTSWRMPLPFNEFILQRIYLMK